MMTREQFSAGLVGALVASLLLIFGCAIWANGYERAQHLNASKHNPDSFFAVATVEHGNEILTFSCVIDETVCFAMLPNGRMGSIHIRPERGE